MLSRLTPGLGAGKSLTALKYDCQDESCGPIGYSSILDRKFQNMPSPLDFDKFIPFIARGMGLLVTATVTKIVQEDYIEMSSSRKKPKPRKKSKEIEITNEVAGLHASALKGRQVDTSPSTPLAKDDNSFFTNDVFVPIKAYYDIRGQLLKISISGSNLVTQKLIKAINLCIPFHTGLTKLSIVNATVKQEVIYEIGKLLQFSNITDVCLDHTYVRQGNFYSLLDNCRLKRLSLKGCRINDIILKEIANKIDFKQPASENLQILELSTNFITDLGAVILGTILRLNRKLLHINLAGNRITDKGAIFLLDQLMLFRLTENDIIEKSRRKQAYFEEWAKVFDRCYQEQLKKQRKIGDATTNEITGRKGAAGHLKPLKQGKAKPKQIDVKEIAEAISLKVMGGPFKDVFDDAHLTYKNGITYCTGNLTLCSLNLCYNDLSYFCIKKVLEVVKYQHSNPKRLEESGLLRIVLEGNYIPLACEELEWIDMYLTKAIHDRLPPEKNRRKMSEIGFTMTTKT